MLIGWVKGSIGAWVPGLRQDRVGSHLGVHERVHEIQSARGSARALVVVVVVVASFASGERG